MPYTNPDIRKACVRESQRKRRSGECKPQNDLSTPEQPSFSQLRVQRAQDLMDLLEEQVNAVRSTPADSLFKARTIGYLIGIGVRLIESRDLEERIRALEETLKERQSR